MCGSQVPGGSLPHQHRGGVASPHSYEQTSGHDAGSVMGELTGGLRYGLVVRITLDEGGGDRASVPRMAGSMAAELNTLNFFSYPGPRAADS